MKPLLLTLLLCTALHAEEDQKNSEIKRNATVNIGYSPYFNSNEGMKDMPLTTLQIYSWIADQPIKLINKAPSLTAIPLRVGILFGDFILHTPWLGDFYKNQNETWAFHEKWWPSTAFYHEFGHYRAITALSSAKANYTFETKDGNSFVSIITNDPFDFYWQSLKNQSLVYNALTNNFHPELCSVKGEMIVTGGGLNNEARLSKEITELIYKNGGHIAYFWLYFRGHFGMVSYSKKELSGIFGDIEHSSSDIAHYKKAFDRRFPGEKLDINKLVTGGFLGLFLSGTTYSFLKGYWDFVTTGNTTVETLTLGGFRAPDANFYLTQDGLSLEFCSAYEYSKSLWITLGIETNYHPIVNFEFSPGIRYLIATPFGDIDLEANLVFNWDSKAFGAATTAEWNINPYLSVFSTFIDHNYTTYAGARNTPKASVDTSHCFEFLTGVSVHY